tara:strand:+ start:1086 stop:1784 length:699 start_codon:yes stop_codon:yes gene_type:complete
MQEYKVKNRYHKVYEIDEVPGEIRYKEDWRTGQVGDWVLTDDNCVIQILRKKKMKGLITVGTCTGTYKVGDKFLMDTVKKSSIYTLGGVSWYTKIQEREEPTSKEKMFAYRHALGESPLNAYMKVYKSSLGHAKRMSALLMKQERIQKIVNEELKDTFQELEIDLKFLIEQAKDRVLGAKNDSDRINALKMLWDAYGVVKQEKVTQVTGIFQGHTTGQLESAKRPQLGESND